MNGTDGVMMPFRNLDTLESWLQEFRALGYPIAGSVRVIPQDGDGGANTGLVTVRLANASTPTSIQPSDEDPTRWVATMEPRDASVILDAPRLLELSGELAMISALCGFLQAKSQAYTSADEA
ncbi:hypothetical protein [uncultured Microbacterium sp.]|uniref:hypothetical protein n=1 Tax=uncultured Microbacterium sp. TaxID=191216 RepID=UPI0028D18587|nr:hypothetical protein [uncultured Microbacterium sp.]